MKFNKIADFCDAVIETSSTMVLALDPDGKIIDITPNARDITGYSISEIKGKNWFDIFISHEERKSSYEYFRNMIIRGKTPQYVNRILKKNKNEIFIEWNHKIYQDSADNVIGVLAVGYDVSERIKTESELKKERFELIERNKELTCLYGMAKVVEHPDVTLQEILQSVTALIPPAFQYPEIASAAIHLDRQLYCTAGYEQSKHKLSEKVFVQGKKRGKVKVVYSEEKEKSTDKTISFLKEEHNLLKTIARQLALIIEKREADEKRLELEGQLRHADRLAKVGQLTAGVAHELNEPLGNILGFAQLADKNSDLPEQVYKDIKNIIQSALHAREIIKKLMLFSRQMPSKKKRVNLNTLIEDALSFIEPRFATTEVEFIRELDQSVLEITADPSQLTQVLVNLAINAVQAMPKGGTLTIKTLAENEHVVFTVQDTGIGMDQETIKQIFLPFFTTKDVDQGTGLGLSVVHGIIVAHGGEIDVHSHIGQGTRFEIKFPANSTNKEE